jgi:hypothetical protein
MIRERSWGSHVLLWMISLQGIPYSRCCLGCTCVDFCNVRFNDLYHSLVVASSTSRLYDALSTKPFLCSANDDAEANVLYSMDCNSVACCQPVAILGSS